MSEGYTGKVLLRRIYLDQGGYDEFGAYWGSGPPLYRWDIEDLNAARDAGVDLLGNVVRAGSRVNAKAKIRALPGMAGCKFYN